MAKKLQNIHLTYNNFLIVQGLRQGHNQILLIIDLKEFIKINLDMDMMIKNVKLVESNSCSCFPEYGNFKDELKECKRLCFNKNHQ